MCVDKEVEGRLLECNSSFMVKLNCGHHDDGIGGVGGRIFRVSLFSDLTAAVRDFEIQKCTFGLLILKCKLKSQRHIQNSKTDGKNPIFDLFSFRFHPPIIDHHRLIKQTTACH